ncbi:hypothetical protein Vi05172_g5078 [Venturia inaequalis]|nr:hypothetical protein Vi05172_g5078 [Venturia inaequalis]
MLFNTASIIATLSVLLIATTNAAPNPAANPDPNQDGTLRECYAFEVMCNANCGLGVCIRRPLPNPNPQHDAIYCCA